MRRPSPVPAVLVLTIVALSLPFTLAVATSAFAQEPQPPTGGPQQPGGQPQQPGEQPTTTTPTPQAPATEQLPRTGSDAALYFAIGIVLLLVGARLRVLTRIKEVVDRVRRRKPEVALREALEPIRVARLSPPGQDPASGPLHVEPSTPTARRAAGVGSTGDD
jgi:LPXTG-motif cell wall-anchored protein